MLNLEVAELQQPPHIRFHSCQPRTGIWEYSGHRLSETGQGKCDESWFLLQCEDVGGVDARGRTSSPRHGGADKRRTQDTAACRYMAVTQHIAL
ncbi:hypothetical protein PGIGA_G00205760 [Pangasianodon gigas]|uniref:Uncharacterized protein n=1 Tax=Pangasianodon gigas TaxID=30993 RepID=A0ACC5WG17_PANGG|nr:hypothetical protein [Pangasianodon gigas]